MKLILFGNRGSKPLGASENSPFGKYGGDTTCMGVVFDDGAILSLDAGSGFWKWPYTLKTLMRHDGPYNMQLLLSHYHDDHVQGLAQSPFLFEQENKIDIYGPDFEPGLEQVFHDNANKPRNPDLANHYQANLSFHELSESDSNKTITLDNGAEITWLAVKHGAEKSLGYRIDHDEKSLAVISDTDHVFDADDNPVLDREIIEFIRDADTLVYDCHFSDKELKDLPFYRGFGHSTGEHGVRLCEAANVPMLITHHHNPNNDDTKMDAMTKALRLYGAEKNVYVLAAKPSLCIDLDLHPSAIRQDIEQQDTPEQRWNKISVVGNRR